MAFTNGVSRSRRELWVIYAKKSGKQRVFSRKARFKALPNGRFPRPAGPIIFETHDVGGDCALYMMG